MASCQLLRPEWLWLLPLLVLLLWLLARRGGPAGGWRSVCDPRLLPFILQGSEARAARWPLLAVGVAGLLTILALAGPACEQREQPVFRDPSALVIALDLSRSMDATDLSPSRLARARLKLIDILKQRREGQTALIVYAATAFTVAPLTDDANTIIALVSALDSNIMPLQGSNPAAAVARATQLLQQAGVPEGDILLITDGIEADALAPTLAALEGRAHRLSVLAAGTPAGAPIALRDGGFLQDSHGAIVVPKLDPVLLERLARQGGGRYHPLSADDSDIDHLLAPLDARQAAGTAVRGVASDQWREEGPWLLLLVLPLAALAFRRGYLAVLLIVLLPLPPPVEAAGLLDLWRNEDQQALQRLRQGDAEQAAELFTDPSWQAVARYRAGQYRQTVEALQGLATADALYNTGNALARLGDYPAAIEAYDQALALQPDHEDARYNRALVQQQLQRQAHQGEDGDGRQQDSAGGRQAPPGQQGEQSAAQQQPGPQGEQAEAATPGRQQQQTAPRQQAGEESGQQAAQSAGAAQPQGRDPAGESATAEQPHLTPSRDHSETSETDLATEQWLRRIPDDPGGLLRRKFQYQYQQQARQRRESDMQPW